MDIAQAQQILRDALVSLMTEHHDLCTSGANERSVTSQLFRYVADHELIPQGVNVDHEYNRVGPHDVKNLRRYVDDYPELDEYGEPVESRALPDILIHSRGDHKTNLVAVETKVGAPCSGRDIAKIRALTSEPFAYAHGVLLSLRLEADGERRFWNPQWAWNPQEDDPIVYERVFAASDLARVVSEGREKVARRRAPRT